MKKYDILIIDDEREVAHSIRDALSVLEIYSPSVALNGAEALERASKECFDAFLVDQIMPGMSGTEFVRRLLEVVSMPLVYVITAEDDGVALAAAERLPNQGGLPIKRYVQKPWQQSLFTVDLREDLRERDLSRELNMTLERYTTEQKEIQQELDKAQSGIAEAEKRDAAMAAAITVVKAANHEINNINMGFTGCTMRLENFLKDGASVLAAKDLTTLTKLCDSQAKLSGRLKDYAGFITALFTRSDEKKHVASLCEIIKSSLDDLLAERDCSAITIERNIPPEILTECYSQQLRYAFYQILKNGVDAMPGGGILRIDVFACEEEIVVSLRDSGKGIPRENLNMIFIPLFTRTKIYGGKGGCIAHRIICENHQGCIVVESTVENPLERPSATNNSPGTKVTITLPR